MQKQIEIQNTVFDLDTFSDVKLVKRPTIEIPDSVQDALNAFNGAEDELLKVIQDGVEARERRRLRKESEGWHTFADDEETEVNGEFSGTPADMKAVNALRLTLAKTLFGYNQAKTPQDKKAAKQAAEDMIKSNDAMKAGLRNSAAATTESED